MTTQPDTRSTKKHPRRPMLDKDVADQLAATEYQRVAELFAQLTPDQWKAPTDCPAWDVRAMAGHMLGMVQMIATVPEMMRQQLAAGRRVKHGGGLVIDALTALQVEKNAGLSTEELVDQMHRLGPKAAKARRRAPGVIRNRVIADEDGWWTLGYLFDVILTRDPFLHRVDIARATGAPMRATPEHEGVILDDVVHEWGDRHASAYHLELTGPAGGRWQRGEAELVSMDAFEFCRALSGRAPAVGLLGTRVPF